jgi:predicted glycosyltransferase involved in capsule biosynthesis
VDKGKLGIDSWFFRPDNGASQWNKKYNRMKTNLEDLTFLFPLKPDSIIRIENLLSINNYLCSQFKTNIAVLEVSTYNNGFLKKLLNKEIKYSFIEDKDPIFYRTKYINLIAKAVDTPFLAVWDADVIVDKELIIDSITKLRTGEADVTYPYNGKFYDTTPIIRSLFIKKKNIEVLHRYKDRMSLIYGENHKGGSFIVNTEKYNRIGLENERFYGWGPEDYERYERWTNLNFKIYRASGCMYHLSHPRDINGRFSSQRQSEMKNAERTKSKNSSYGELTLITTISPAPPDPPDARPDLAPIHVRF